jgi:hypothetical protein
MDSPGILSVRHLALCLSAVLIVAFVELKYPPLRGTAANRSFQSISSAQGAAPTPIVLTASRIDSHSVDLHWIDPQGNQVVAGYEIFRNGQKLANGDWNAGPYFRDSHVSPSLTYTYAVATFDKSGHHSSQSRSITIKTLANGSGNKYTISPTDAPATIYGILDNAGCGDTVSIDPGTYSVANGHAAMIYIKDKRCTTNNLYIIQASDPNNPPVFDYTGYLLDGQQTPVPNHWTPWESDFFRAAWQVRNSSYVVLNGLHIKGARSGSTDAVAGVRYLATDHISIRHCVFERNYDGLEGNGTNTVVEYNTFLANGYPGEDQQHQFYDTGGDSLTVRYNYFNDDGCEECGQNLHIRSWHSAIYGNWLQDGSDYEWDMMTPPAGYPAPSDGTMTQQFYNNVVVTSPHPRNTSKVFTFYADGAGMANGKMKLDAEWNTFWISAPPGILNNYSIFQISNYSSGANKIAGIELHFTNNIVHFAGTSSWHNSKPQLFVVMDGGPWFIDGSNNWFDSALANPCAPRGRSSGGSCQITNSTSGDTPSFRNLAGMDLRPTSGNHPFGSADTGQPLKSPNQQFPAGPANVRPRTSFDDVGALQYSQ